MSKFITDISRIKRADLLNINIDKTSFVFKINHLDGIQFFFSGKRYCEVLQ